MAPVTTLANSGGLVEAVRKLEYVYYPYKADEMPALRQDKTLAQQYAALKEKASADNRTDRQACTLAKAPLIVAAIRRTANRSKVR